MRTLALLLALPAFPALAEDWGDPAATWRLTEIDGAAFTAEATVTFPEPGRYGGKAPCNRYSGSFEGPPAGFALGPAAATRMACPDLEAESAFFEALGAMNRGVLGEGLMILTDGTSRHMVFQRD